MRTVSVKLQSSLLKEVDRNLVKHRYGTRTEFIREAVRDKLKDLETEAALLRLEKMYGAGKGRHHTTDADLHKARDAAMRELAKKLKMGSE